MTRYIPHKPSIKQAAFLLLDHIPEILYGGAAGGGKSDALLMAALQYVDHLGYSALILRRTFKQLSLADAIMERAHEWLSDTRAHWRGENKTWYFPTSGTPATLAFGHMEHENIKYDYQGAAFNFVGFDELTQFTESMYTYLFSRTRRTHDSSLPTRIRSGSNPGGIGHEWVKSRFVVGRDGTRLFLPAKLTDNPHLDQEDYKRQLSKLDPVTRKQLEDGDWDVLPTGVYFQRNWFPIVTQYPTTGRRMVRYWDLAATEQTRKASDPDWTVGTLLTVVDGTTWVIDVKRLRGTPQRVEAAVKSAAYEDGKGVNIYIEQEPGASGKSVIDHYKRRVVPGFAVYSDRPTGEKAVRARPLSAAAEAGNVLVVEGAWNEDWFRELQAFPNEGVHDDQVDSVAGAFNMAHEIRQASYTRVAR